MAILTVAQFKQRFDVDRITQLASDKSGQFGSVKYSEGIVTAILAEAEGIVKNSLSLQYTTSEIEADAGVRRITADIAIYLLESRRPPVEAETARAHKLALELLVQLQQGQAKLTAVQQLLPTGPTEEETEYLDSGYFD